MLKILKATISALFLFTLFYLVGAFYATTFDISKWPDITRWIVSVMGFFCVIVGAVILIHESNK